MDDDLVWSVEETDAAVVLVVRGDLARRSSTSLDEVVRKLLLDRGRLLVDVSDVHLRWSLAATLFATALSSAGGWPLARLVLVDGGGSVVAGLRAAGSTAEVPVLPDRAAGVEALGRRPRRVRRSSGLPSGPVIPRFARELVLASCADWGVDDGDRAAVVANELVTNAVEHTSGRSMLTLSHDQRGLTFAVWDSGVGDRVSTAASAGSLGLRVVEELSDRWGVTRHDDGKTVWALLTSQSVDGWV
jgi:signal transduction histidine kinase